MAIGSTTNIKSIIQPHNRAAQGQFDVNSWFADEVLDISFGESVGRPHHSYAMKEEYLALFLQNGWSFDSRYAGREGGNWSKTSVRETDGISAETNSENSSDKNSTSTTYEHSSTTESGDPWWYTENRFRLRRRRLQADRVLKSITDTFVTRYNEGVANEDARYNELVTLYGVMLNKNEADGGALVSGALDVKGLFNKLSASINTTWSAAHNKAISAAQAADEGAVIEVTREYEALISKTRSQMIGQGTYNGTVWPTVEAGIRRQMADAIAEAKAKGLTQATNALTGVLEAKGDVMSKLVNAKNAIAEAIDNRKITAINLRNTVLQAMLNFMAGREDVYPQLQEISACASQIGFSVGATGNFG